MTNLVPVLLTEHLILFSGPTHPLHDVFLALGRQQARLIRLINLRDLILIGAPALASVSLRQVVLYLTLDRLDAIGVGHVPSMAERLLRPWRADGAQMLVELLKLRRSESEANQKRIG